MRFWTTLVGTSLLALASTAHAQTAPDQKAPPKPAPETADAQGSVADIVVTANRREERLQAVPVTVTLVDGNQLSRQNVNAVEDLTRAAPALNLAGPTAFGALSIRGIGTLAFNPTSEGSVGVVVDGVALANTSTNPPLLFDIERVEVLEGPQGMLFGRNASAGLLNIVTKAPNPDRVEGLAHVDIGSRNNYIGRAALNIPLGQNAAVRFAGSFAQDPQNQHNLADGSWIRRESKALRGRFLWKPSDTVTVNLSGDYTDVDVNGGVPWTVYISTPGSVFASRLAACGVTVGPENDAGCQDGRNINSSATYGGSGQVDVAIGDLTLTSISAYRGTKGRKDNDIDSTTSDRLFQHVDSTGRNLSQELRLSSGSGRFVEFVTGLYYFDSTTQGSGSLFGPLYADLPQIYGGCPFGPAFLCSSPYGQIASSSTHTKSYAAFGQATINVSHALRLIAGGRVGHEEVNLTAGATSVVPGAIAVIGSTPASNNTAEDTYFSYRLGAQYDVTHNLMVFGTFTRGYKGPAVNPDGGQIPGVPVIVKPEVPNAVELGFKSTLLGGRAAFNATAFYTNVDNFQSQFIVVDPATQTNVFVFSNAKAFTVKGVTANFFGQPLKGLVVNLGATYTVKAYAKGYSQPDAFGVAVDIGALEPSHEVKFTASGEYTASLGDHWNGFVQADMVYQPTRYFDAARSPVFKVNAAAIFGGRLGVRTIDQRFGVSVFARNIFDTFRATSAFTTPIASLQGDPVSFSQFSGPEAHRVVGLSLDARF